MPGEQSETNGIPHSPPENPAITTHVASPSREFSRELSVEERETRLREWDQLVADLASIHDETDTDEIWDEILANLGVKPGEAG
jgi:hypothetical protein